MNMKVLSWNCQGILGKDTRDHLHHLNAFYASEIIFLSETKINDNRILKLTRFLNMPNNCYVPSIGAAGGLILLRKDSFCLDIINSSDKTIHALVPNDTSKGEWFLSCVYGTPYRTEQADQWEYIRSLSAVNIPWVLLCDLNITLSPGDRNSPSSQGTSSDITNFLRESYLSDLIQIPLVNGQ